MKTLSKLWVISSFIIFHSAAFADNDLSLIKEGKPYQEVKAALSDKGWKPIKNTRIDQSSLYALEIYDQGMTEVTDCISMELDACLFRFSKNSQILEIKTITRELTVDSFRTYKKH
jgi:hypothetical protein